MTIRTNASLLCLLLLGACTAVPKSGPAPAPTVRPPPGQVPPTRPAPPVTTTRAPQVQHIAGLEGVIEHAITKITTASGKVLYLRKSSGLGRVMSPENNAAMVIEAFRRVRTPHKLLIVGDAPYAHDYIEHLRALARRDRRIVFTGFVFGDAYRALQQNAYCYVHAT